MTPSLTRLFQLNPRRLGSNTNPPIAPDLESARSESPSSSDLTFTTAAHEPHCPPVRFSEFDEAAENAVMERIKERMKEWSDGARTARIRASVGSFILGVALVLSTASSLVIAALSGADLSQELHIEYSAWVPLALSIFTACLNLLPRVCPLNEAVAKHLERREKLENATSLCSNLKVQFNLVILTNKPTVYPLPDPFDTDLEDRFGPAADRALLAPRANFRLSELELFVEGRLQLPEVEPSLSANPSPRPPSRTLPTATPPPKYPSPGTSIGPNSTSVYGTLFNRLSNPPKFGTPDERSPFLVGSGSTSPAPMAIPFASGSGGLGLVGAGSFGPRSASLHSNESPVRSSSRGRMRESSDGGSLKNVRF
ncbi:hypothetical protein T439DRAFT_355786 [Meredithblackwellia eburnea MCA 4105]